MSDERPVVLVVEDGTEYSDSLGRFLGDAFEFVRAGDGREALAAVAARKDLRALFLDMRFDRAAVQLGDLAEVADRFNGDTARARRFLEDNQGTYVLAALREAGCTLPALFSYDFDGEPRRLANLQRRYGPLDYLPDTAGPAEVRAALARLCG